MKTVHAFHPSQCLCDIDLSLPDDLPVSSFHYRCLATGQKLQQELLRCLHQRYQYDCPDSFAWISWLISRTTRWLSFSAAITKYSQFWKPFLFGTHDTHIYHIDDMCMCVCVCVYVYVYVWVCVRVCVYTHIHTHTRKRLSSMSELHSLTTSHEFSRIRVFKNRRRKSTRLTCFVINKLLQFKQSPII